MKTLMRQYIRNTIAACCLLVTGSNAMLTHAQENVQFSPIPSVEKPTIDALMPGTDGLMPLDSLSLPRLDSFGRPMLGNTWHTWAWGSMGYWQPWQIHKGLNVSLGASVFSTFGSGHTWSGAGFTQDVSALYATRLSDRLSLAVGGYFSNMMWAHNTYRDAGLTATLGYSVNDRLTAYLYGQKSLTNERPKPFYAYDLGNMGDRIGIAVEYKVTPAFTIGASFDVNVNNRFPHPYPVPSSGQDNKHPF